MDLNAGRGDPLTGPLYGRTVTFLVDSRWTNLALARTIIYRLARSKVPCAVLDIDALYSSNSDHIFGLLSDEEAKVVEITVPELGSALEADLADLLGLSSARVLIIDSLNSFYHLLSVGGQGGKSMKLALAVALLSWAAQTEDRAVLITMYQRAAAARFGRGKSISDLSDLTISVSLKKNSLILTCERGSIWSGRILSVPIP